MFRVDPIPKFGFFHSLFFLHQLIIMIIFHKGHTATNTGFPVHKTPGEETDLNSLIQQQVDISANAFCMNNTVREQIYMHQLVLAVIIEFCQAFAIFRLKNLFRFTVLPMLCRVR